MPSLMAPGVVVLVLAGVLSGGPPAGPGSEGPIERAVGLANHGDVDGAVRVLREHLAGNADDVRARGILGEILDFDGRPDEAVAVWEAGLKGTLADYPLLMSVGEIRRRQGVDGPTMSYRRGMMGASPSKDKVAEARYKKEHLEQAAAALERARKLRPTEPDAAEALATVYDDQGRPDAAAGVWRELTGSEPLKAGYRFRLALAVRKAGRADEAIRVLKETLELDPRLAPAHEALAEIQAERGRKDEAEKSHARAEFYKRLPSFCTLADTDENRATLDHLFQADTVDRLVADPSKRAAEFLAVLCWSHPHDEQEARAFKALEQRGEATTPLLRALLEGAHSTCTIKSTSHILARRKAEGLFEWLAARLPGDVRGAMMDMDVAGALDDLGDPRAVAPLARMLEPGDAASGSDGLLTDRRMARARAALALGAFDTPEARAALEAGTRDRELAPYALAALYRLTNDPARLAALEKAVGDGASYNGLVVGHYLARKVGTEPAKALARRWQAASDAEHARREKAKEKGQEKEPPAERP